MKNYVLLFLFIAPFTVIAQKTPKIIKGQIYVDSIPVSDVHILNKTLEIGTISNTNGTFEILANIGDALLISHLNVEILEHTITSKDIENKNISIYLSSKTYILNEVVIKKRKGIFDVDDDIMPHNAPIVNAKTLNLPYALSEKAKAEKTVKIRSGVVVGLDGALNALNGKNKQKKLLKKLKNEDTNLKKIRSYFTDGFFVYQLNIKKEDINHFLEYSFSKGIIQLYNEDKYLELTTVLLERSKHFPHQSGIDSTRITQK
jgi:hypothetical protein